MTALFDLTCARLWEEDLLSAREIARRLDCCHTTVLKALRRLGIDPTWGRDYRTPRAVQEEIRRLTEAGWSQKQICARVRRSHVCVRRWQRLQAE